MNTIVLLATAWGSRHGGINVVNMELARALAEVLRSAGRVVCVVPYAEENDTKDAEGAGVKLVSLELCPDTLPDNFDPGWIGTVEKKLEVHGVEAMDWCIGHDAISGAAANQMKQNKSAKASAVINHMSYGDYQGIKHDDLAEVHRKIREQNRILKNANVVIAVGPLLRKRASDAVGRDVPQFIPGLSTIDPHPSPHQFIAVALGRFERENDRIKQVQLSAEGFAEALIRSRKPGGPPSLEDNPIIKLVGIPAVDVPRLKSIMYTRANQLVNLHPIPYQEDREQLYEEIARSSVALMLSWHEGFGLTGWEAIAAEVPLIVTRQSGLYQFLEQQGLGGLVRSLKVEGGHGGDNGQNFSDADRGNVADLILDVARGSDAARQAAKSLKSILVNKDFTWRRAARDVLAALNVSLPSDAGRPSTPDGGTMNTTESSPETGPTLVAYLRSLREIAGLVKLAGDDAPRALQNVFVELEVSRSGALNQQEYSDADPSAIQGDSLALETELRRRKSAPWRQLTETIPAQDLLEFAHRTLIVGAAGTGKSTLLRWLACEAAKRRESDPQARIPVWLERLPHHCDLDADLAGELAKKALAKMKLGEGPSPALRAIREAIASGGALILIDGVDESGVVEQAHAADWLYKLECRTIVASRPLLGTAPLNDGVVLTLHGIPGIAAEQLLKRYFPGEEWVDGLIRELLGLPDSQTWLETPVLLGLAATLYRSDKAIPAASIDLYGSVIDHLLKSEKLPKKFQGDVLRGQLCAFARERLLPAKGPPRVVFNWSEVLPSLQDLYKLTGLFDGADAFRFTHLTLGERLAAETEMDLNVERAKLVAIDVQSPEGGALEVLPMAHALQGLTVLQEALTDAQRRDLTDHRILRLLLRSISYGGAGVQAFCRTHAGTVIQLVAERLDAPSGRFGEAEMALMDAAERAFVMMRGMLDAAELERLFGRLLRAPGNVGTEAHVATWMLGGGRPVRRESNLWPTVERQARALVRANVDVDGVVALTTGAHYIHQGRAASDLAKHRELWPRLRPLLYHSEETVRGVVIDILASDVGSEADWSERLGDEDPRVRARCVNHLANNPDRRTVYLPLLRHMLTRDPDAMVKAAVIDALCDDAPSRPAIRDILVEVSSSELNVGPLVELQGSAMRALANDVESEDFVRMSILRPKVWFNWEDTIQRLARIPKWRAMLIERLASPDVTGSEIKALADFTEAEGALRKLLDGDSGRRLCAVKALGSRIEQSRLIDMLRENDIPLRCAVIDALGKQPGTESILREFLSKSPSERIAAAKALARDARALGEIEDNLLRSPDYSVRVAAIDALSGHSIAFHALQGYFDETRSSPKEEVETDEIGRPVRVLSHGLLRARILKALAKDPKYRTLVVNSLDDPHEAVRAEAVKSLAIVPEMRERLRQQFETDESVYDASCEVMSDVSFVQNQLLASLDADLDALRFAAFRYLVDRADTREMLKKMLSCSSTPENWRATIIGPLMRDPESMGLVRTCVHDDSRDVRNEALRALRHDRGVRQDLRERARDVRWLGSIDLLSQERIANVLGDDPEAHHVLIRHLDVENDRVLAFVVRVLRDCPEVRERFVALLDHPSIEVQAEAMRALGGHEPIRQRLLAALVAEERMTPGTDADLARSMRQLANLRTLRMAAADALRDIPEMRSKFRALLHDENDGVRESAIRAVSTDRSPDAVRLLRERLGLEASESHCLRIIHGLRADSESVNPLRERLHGDRRRSVRFAAAHALGTGELSRGYALRELSSVARVCRSFAEGDAPGLEALSEFMSNPRRLELDAEPALGEDVLAWSCARLAWAYEADRIADGQVLGEVECSVDQIARPGGVILIRVAMDAFDLPRERFLRPMHNLLETWKIAQYLISGDPPSVVLACGDVSFGNLKPPTLEPGEVRFGPTFFAFRVCALR